MGIFETEGTPIEEIAAVNQLTVLDLSDSDERLSETIIAVLCRKIFDDQKAICKRRRRRLQYASIHNSRGST